MQLLLLFSHLFLLLTSRIQLIYSFLRLFEFGASHNIPIVGAGWIQDINENVPDWKWYQCDREDEMTYDDKRIISQIEDPEQVIIPDNNLTKEFIVNLLLLYIQSLC